MTSQFESHVAEGLNDYRFVATLHIQHPVICPDEITAILAIVPRCIQRRGEQRRTPAGTMLRGTYSENHWSADLPVISGHDVSDFLLDLVQRQMCFAKEWTRQVETTGGSVTVFVGLIAKRCCDFEVPPSTLRRLGNAGIAVRLDYYRDETELDLDVDGRIEH